ncbi:tRNA dimethylallyltransferase [Caldithrix abyssi DSM 13497]|uniref:tRNA dimethylallyltransferase n=1 Tax=Caldithrix abyssi DSM 13497 TaxID=880073 RepID=H1XVJ9_CALAY|nr:tRNA (adenosine(37)-N6)-dimethylallyltransferase MiaA [Caldithrix abyssi]APF18940.1 miaA tRNA dimethylallyltransferase [Caldithrix abyssi DSM 13497]EHO42899.1 tRNA dimethylallyltransferase [Caldithrix abyssi DSM 13497]
MKRVVHFIVGPTAIGKTFLSALLAEKIKVEIISADSRQIYRFMDIGTAKPEAEFRRRVTHHFIDICDPDEYYSAGLFGKDARAAIQDIFVRGSVPLVVGGSGFYIKALVDGIFELDAKDEKIRQQLNERLERDGLRALYDDLKKIDPVYAAKISPNDRQRILRSLEVYFVTGKPFSYFHQQKPEAADFKPAFWGLDMERKALYQRINERVDQMLAEGLIDEVKTLLGKGYSPQLNALKTVGYKETIAYLQNRLSYEEMVEQIKRNTRRYAKRQLTWFRADQRIQWTRVDSPETFRELAKKIADAL